MKYSLVFLLVSATNIQGDCYLASLYYSEFTMGLMH
jgi:hypothetical protein